ncbi:hypothetical protein E1181_11595 [Saccharopolyspora terrae]|uniref:Uncharacterized protein n=1 Tax=Saccharopolyspora terrae TaxID=2530384 RepID=A0A4R4VTM8_9PSEU|nr:hypothetical protein [Saccharopolyspora terrae]TDD06643.1 hypothetical protein E1181_11595 [Saccharopolyspora terrae]
MYLPSFVKQFLELIKDYDPPAVSAAAAVCSLVVSTAAAFFAFRAYRKQSGQLNLAQKHDLRWQSSKIAAWIAEDDGCGTSRIGTTTVNHFVDHGLWYINASDLPVYQVHLLVDNQESARWIRYKCVTVYERLMPTEEPQCLPLDARKVFPRSVELAKQLHDEMPVEIHEKVAKDPLLGGGLTSEQRNQHNKAWAALQASMEEELRYLMKTGVLDFRDSEGNRWRRHLDGHLETVRLSSPRIVSG